MLAAVNYSNLPTHTHEHTHPHTRIQTWSRLRNRHRKPSRIDSRSIRFRFVPIRYEVSKYRIVIDFFNFDFGIYICMFSEKSVLFRYYRNVTDSYRKKVITSKITVLLPIFFPPSLFHRFDTDVYNK
jgi:hypothetical protein